MANYLVTGGAGFIGSHLATALVAKGHGVTVLDNLSTGFRQKVPAGARLVVGDILDKDVVDELVGEADACFHLAAIASVQRSIEDWAGTHRINLTGTINILDAARRSRSPVVYASSAAVYGDQNRFPITEDSVKRPMTAYGADKLGCELHAVIAGGLGVPSAGLRFFNVYGVGQDPRSPYSGVISVFTDRLSRHEPVTIFGNGKQVRDFVHVSDVVRHLIAALPAASAAAPVFNVCTGQPTSVETLARTLKALLASNGEIAWGSPRQGDIRVSLGCPRRATAALGVSARVMLEDGLRTMVETAEDARLAA
ncbi:MAG: NAD-dependent epimerase/dehydratase family protein [Reyranellaceae bacterium]